MGLRNSRIALMTLLEWCSWRRSDVGRAMGADVRELLLQIEEFLVGEELGFAGADEEGWGLEAGKAVADGFHAEGAVVEVGLGGHAEEAKARGGGIDVGRVR